MLLFNAIKNGLFNDTKTQIPKTKIYLTGINHTTTELIEIKKQRFIVINWFF